MPEDVVGVGVREVVDAGEHLPLVVRLPPLRQAEGEIPEARVLGMGATRQFEQVPEVCRDGHAVHAVGGRPVAPASWEQRWERLGKIILSLELGDRGRVLRGAP